MLPREDYEYWSDARKEARKTGINEGACGRAAWMALKKHNPSITRKVEIEFFVAHFGYALQVNDDETISAPPLDDYKPMSGSSKDVTLEDEINRRGILSMTMNRNRDIELPHRIENKQGEGVEPLVGEGVHAWKHNPRVNFRETIAFVAEYIGRADVTPEVCPSGTAWNLLRWARRGNDTTFFKDLFARLVPSQAKIQAEEEREGREGVAFEDALAMLEKAMDSGESQEDELAVNELMEDEGLKGYMPDALPDDVDGDDDSSSISVPSDDYVPMPPPTHKLPNNSKGGRPSHRDPLMPVEKRHG